MPTQGPVWRAQVAINVFGIPVPVVIADPPASVARIRDTVRVLRFH
ncbi:MAG TPA: hypothetical protein VE569_11465 [Acidimicrobiia bacterium]|nr:hypothetical protein [Acidimicrobiia bacterium]